MMDAKKATVRIGIFDRPNKRFIELGSGAVVSDQGHVITAAHLFVACKYPPGHPYHLALYNMVPERDILIAIGTYKNDRTPAQWKFWAERLTPLELLRVRAQRGVATSRRATSRRRERLRGRGRRGWRW